MALEGVNNNQKNVSGNKEDFETFADRLNKTFPDRTFTVEEKKEAIAAKKKIMDILIVQLIQRKFCKKKLQLLKAKSNECRAFSAKEMI